MRIRAFLLLGLLPALFGACTTLKVIPATAHTSESSRELYYFDSDSRISYRVFHDRDTLHLKLKTDQRSTMVKMLRQGTTVYFDLTGKKKKKIYVRYPIPGQMDQAFRQSRLQDLDAGQRPGTGSMIQNLPEDLLYVSYGTEELIRPSSPYDRDIHCELSMEKERILVYKLKIPFSRITEEGLSSINTLSIGIEARGIDLPGGSSMRPAAQMGRPGSMSGGGRRPGGRSPGGRPPGGMTPGRRPSGTGSGAARQIDREALTSTTEIWFQVELLK